MIEVQGKCSKRFEPLKDAFYHNFKEKLDTGAALSVYYKGKKEVDIWAGYKNKTTQELWQENTTVLFFSVTKGLAALCFLMLADKKKFTYEEKVTNYWPEFGQNGKENITIKQLLEHTAGLSALNTSLKMSDFQYDRKKVYDSLIHQKPLWKPGEGQGYGAQIWGAYIGELFERIAGESAGSFFHREVAKKLKLNLYLGLPDEEKHNVAHINYLKSFDRIKNALPYLIKGNTLDARVSKAVLKFNSIARKALSNPSFGKLGMDVFNESWLHKLELLWANGIGDARSLAKIYNLLANNGKQGKVKLFSSKWIKQLSKPNEMRYDKVIQKNMGWNLGFLKEESNIYSPNFEAFGHAGMGGWVAFADPKEKLSFAYIGNQMDPHVRPPKTLALCRSLYQCIM